jgi:hypothetical protein
MLPSLMAEIIIDNHSYSVNDCQKGGDHHDLLRRALKTIIDNDHFPGGSFPCSKCGQEIIVQRSPAGIGVSLSPTKPKV